MSKTHANRLIDSSEVVGNLTPTGVIPSSERQARPLAALPPEERAEAWEEANEEAEAEAAAQNTRTLHGPRLAPSAPARARHRRASGHPAAMAGA